MEQRGWETSNKAMDKRNTVKCQKEREGEEQMQIGFTELNID